MILRAYSPRISGSVALLTGLLSLAVALHAQPPVSEDASPTRGTMPEDYLPGLRAILESGLKVSPTMMMQRIQIAQDEANLLGADASLYPQISANATYGITDEKVGEAGTAGSTSTSKGLTYNVGLSQTLFQWGATWNQTRVSKLGLLIQEKNTAETYRTFVLTLRDLYIGLIMQKISLRNAQYYLQLVKTQLDLTEDGIKSGRIAPTALGGPDLAYGDAKLAFDRQQAVYGHSKRVLAQLSGLPEIDEDTVPMQLPKVAYAPTVAESLLASFMNTGGRYTYAAESLELEIRQQQLNYKIAEVRNLPKLYGSAGLSLTNQTSISLTPEPAGQAPIPAAIAQVKTTSESYGISGSMDIFDGFATTAAMRQARDQKRYFEEQLQSSLDTTLEQAQDYRRQAEFSARAVEQAQTRYNYSANSAQQTAENYRLGTVPRSAVDSSTYDLYNNELTLDSARGDFLSRWSYFVSLVGADPALSELPVQYVRAIP
jgi:outer membrane protein TolC